MASFMASPNWAEAATTGCFSNETIQQWASCEYWMWGSYIFFSIRRAMAEVLRSFLHSSKALIAPVYSQWRTPRSEAALWFFSRSMSLSMAFRIIRKNSIGVSDSLQSGEAYGFGGCFSAHFDWIRDNFFYII